MSIEINIRKVPLSVMAISVSVVFLVLVVCSVSMGGFADQGFITSPEYDGKLCFDAQKKLCFDSAIPSPSVAIDKS